MSRSCITLIKWLHPSREHSLRSRETFIAVNCAAIPDNLIESELFGHEKGSFTGATTQRIGKFEQCDRGTIFLDEIGDMALATQTKILRVLQEGEIQRVGGTETIKVDVRVIAATNKDLDKMVEEKAFREDLYYRLNVFRIRVPSLAERKEDIPDIVDFMLQNLVKERKAKATRVSADALKTLLAYSWPGNVRELGNVVYHSSVVAQGDAVLQKDLPETIRSKVSVQGELEAASGEELNPLEVSTETSESIGETGQASREVEPASSAPSSLIRLPETYDHLYKSLRERREVKILALIEKQMIERAIAETGGNQARAAEILGITRNTLKKRLDDYSGN